jgi:predicted phosphate transport protein (TIGR00153 family)
MPRSVAADLLYDRAAMARLRLTPQNREFYELYSRASANTVEIARLLVELLERFPAGNGDLITRIKEREHEGDHLTHEVVDLLNRTFVTPFDRDDMYRLAGAIDDICDHVDEAAGNLATYGIEQVPEKAVEQARVIHQAARNLDSAVQRLEGFKDSQPQLIELRRLEDEGDRLVRDAVGELFNTEPDPIAIIRWKDIHERLEDACDALENAADVLEAILVKNR